MSNTDTILVQNMHPNTEEPDEGSLEVEVKTGVPTSLSNLPLNSLSASKAKLSRANSSTYSNQTHFSIPSGAGLVKTSVSESMNDSLVNPLSLRRIANSTQQPASLNNIDYTIITSPNPPDALKDR